MLTLSKYYSIRPSQKDKPLVGGEVQYRIQPNRYSFYKKAISSIRGTDETPSNLLQSGFFQNLKYN